MYKPGVMLDRSLGKLLTRVEVEACGKREVYRSSCLSVSCNACKNENASVCKNHQKSMMYSGPSASEDQRVSSFQAGASERC